MLLHVSYNRVDHIIRRIWVGLFCSLRYFVVLVLRGETECLNRTLLIVRTKDGKKVSTTSPTMLTERVTSGRQLSLCLRYIRRPDWSREESPTKWHRSRTFKVSLSSSRLCSINPLVVNWAGLTRVDVYPLHPRPLSRRYCQFLWFRVQVTTWAWVWGPRSPISLFGSVYVSYSVFYIAGREVLKAELVCSPLEVFVFWAALHSLSRLSAWEMLPLSPIVARWWEKASVGSWSMLYGIDREHRRETPKMRKRISKADTSDQPSL